MSRLFFFASAALLIANGCADSAQLRVVPGSSAQNLVFEFSAGQNQSPPPLEWIAVEGGPSAPRGPGSDAHGYAWYAAHVEGAVDPPESTAVRRIRYGVAPPAMANASVPAPLLPGAYVVRAAATGFSAEAQFHVGRDGSIR